jgi:predicted transcriptional regulator
MDQAICDIIGHKKYYNTKNIARDLKIKRKTASYPLHNCDKVKLVVPLDVGSGKKNVMVWGLKP